MEKIERCIRKKNAKFFKSLHEKSFKNTLKCFKIFDFGEYNTLKKILLQKQLFLLGKNSTCFREKDFKIIL